MEFSTRLSISHCTNHRGTALSAHSVAFTGPGTQKLLKEGSTTGDSALSHCICSNESLLRNTTTVVLFQVLFQPLLCQLLYAMAYVWGAVKDTEKWGWTCYEEACMLFKKKSPHVYLQLLKEIVIVQIGKGEIPQLFLYIGFLETFSITCWWTSWRR